MTEDPILGAFGRLVARAPETTLVASVAETWSASRVDGLARAVLHRLREARLPEGAGVGLVAPDGAGFLACYLAARRAGLVVALLDHKTPPPERDEIGASLGLAAVLACRCAGPASADDVRILRRDDAARPAPHRFDPAVSTLRMTSGSTGVPRGVMLSSEALFRDDDQLARTMGLAPDETILASVPLSHSYGFSSIVLPALLRGSTIVVPDGGSPFGVLDAMRRFEVTFFPTVPSYLVALLKLSDAPPLPRSLRLVVSAGAPLRPETAERFRATYGMPVRVFYGASECGGITFDREGGAGERGTVGTPVEDVTVELDPAGSGTGDGSGLVVVRSPAAGQGYHPATADDRLGDGRYASRDLGRMERGELRLTGRADDVINVRGEKVHPAEVEHALLQLAGVEEAVVVGVDVPEESTQLVRAFVATADGGPGRDDIVAWCRARLSTHKVPRSVVVLDRIPRNARGKIDRRALARHG